MRIVAAGPSVMVKLTTLRAGLSMRRPCAAPTAAIATVASTSTRVEPGTGCGRGASIQLFRQSSFMGQAIVAWAVRRGAAQRARAAPNIRGR